MSEECKCFVFSGIFWYGLFGSMFCILHFAVFCFLNSNVGLSYFHVFIIFRCMKFLVGYMVFSSASLLGLLGDYMTSIAIQIYQIPIDIISYTIIMFNFAIVGVISIFYQKGIPTYITQYYLVATSVILAWHLSHFDDWTAWTLLVMLALYDLCAVLTPCGPLKALVNLMQAKDAPEMPGLLYEAHLPAGTQRPGGGGGVSSNSSNFVNSTNRRYEGGTNTSSSDYNTRQSENDYSRNNNTDSQITSSTAVATSTAATTTNTPEEIAVAQPSNAADTSTKTVLLQTQEQEQPDNVGPHAFLPLAIAKVYRLPLLSRYTFGMSRRRKKLTLRKRRGGGSDSSINESPLLASPSHDNNEESIEEFYQRNFSVSELITEVDVELPRNGGRIEKLEGSQQRFLVIGKHGEVKRELFMNKKGKVFDVTNENDDDSVYDEDPASIRLGLVRIDYYLLSYHNGNLMILQRNIYLFPHFLSFFLCHSRVISFFTVCLYLKLPCIASLHLRHVC